MTTTPTADPTLVSQLVAELKAMGSLTPTGEKINTLKGAYDTIVDAVVGAEKISSTASTAIAGSDKKAVVVAVLEDVISLPFPFNLIEDQLINLGVDLIVTGFNKYLGKTWLGKLLEPTPAVTPPASPVS